MLFKKIDASSPDNVTSALNFFETPGSNTGIREAVYEEILTLNPITDPPYHFKVGCTRECRRSTHVLDCSRQ
jgi:hypothetical protein